MSTASGACVSFKKQGMIYVREEATPSIIEWTAIDQLKKVVIPFSALEKLQASKEDSPKIMLRLQYKDTDGGGDELMDLKLTFLNRPTMFNIKEALLNIMARRKTVFKDQTSDQTQNLSGSNPPTQAGTPAPGAPGASGASSSTDLLDFSAPNSLSDSNLLKNHALQQKFLLEDKSLRDLFTHAVIQFKLSPVAFWLTRTTQLRTYALTISQHRGMYNVLSTIKPVATLDNQVNVSVTRDMIKEIFETYPVVKMAYDDCVPAKFTMGEFWLRFFNSRLFRRLRGDKINNQNQKGDAVLDAYIYVDTDLGQQSKRQKVSTIIDVEANENDDSQKLGNRPDVSMRFGTTPDEEEVKSNDLGPSTVAEKEILVMMRNMNKLSSKVVNNSRTPMQDEVQEVSNLYQDLEELSGQDFVRLNLTTTLRKPTEVNTAKDADPAAVSAYLQASMFQPVVGGHDLSLVMKKKEEIDQTSADIIGLIKHNWRLFRMGKASNQLQVISKAQILRIINTHLTSMELLTHFWNGFLSGEKSQAVATRKVMVLLKKCQLEFEDIEKQCLEEVKKHTEEPKLLTKLTKEVHDCLESDKNGLAEVFKVYTRALSELPDDSSNQPII